MVEAISAATVFPAWAVPAGGSFDTRSPNPQQAVHGFESLFIETMLEHAGIARALGGEDGGQAGAAGELLIRELSQTLAQQLSLGWGASLGVASKQTELSGETAHE
jgi:hypothetical protein